jgi:4-carboxymuconolactone decarboxylase
MSDLSPRDLELVAIGAAMGSNCPPCLAYHIPQARQVGLSDAEIHAAIVHADKIRQVPARKTLQTALAMLPGVVPEAAGDASAPECGCAQPNPAANQPVATAARACC